MPLSKHSQFSNCIYDGDRSVEDMPVAVLGMGKSGTACTQFLVGRGAVVTVLDKKPLVDLSEAAQRACNRAEAVIAPYDENTELPELELVVVSPGVPLDDPIIEAAKTAGIPVIGELELAYRFMDAPIVAVTGTCGKGTTATLLGALLEGSGISHVVAGNIGDPLIRHADASESLDAVIAEISSYQLETTTAFHPCIAILLNITRDHLERYETFESYVRAKQLLLANQTPDDWAILCTDDPRVRRLRDTASATVLTVGVDDADANGHRDGEKLVLRLPQQEPVKIARQSDLPLSGDHHLINALAASLAATLLGVSYHDMAAAFRTYQPASHLMQEIGEYEGVTYIDDSKATNPAAAMADLATIDGPVIVIAGGKEKQTGFDEFGDALAKRARPVILIGECATAIENAVGRPQLCKKVASMKQAVELAIDAAEAGDTVALCPACSSLDMFQSYAHRGRRFAECVRDHFRDGEHGEAQS